MNKFLSLIGVAAGLFMAALPSAQAATELIGFNVNGSSKMAISINGSPELATLAKRAFGLHGGFKVASSSSGFDATFTAAGATAVRVELKRGGKVLLSETVTGNSQRNALFKAADLVVKASIGQKGFFASKLAFVSNRSGSDEIYVSDLLLGDATAVTNQHSTLLAPRFSPDGSKILYTSYFKSGFPDIFVIDLAQRRWTTFVSFKGTNSGARFSPDGSKVAMVLSGEGQPEIYVSNSEGRGVSRRTHSVNVKSSPCFSPDGSRIVFAMEPGPQLYVMPASGGTPTRIGGGKYTYCAEPDWSRGDPNKICFTIREGGRFQIAVYDMKTGVTKKVSRESFDAIEPVWLADGRHIVYTARSAGQRSLHILDTESNDGEHSVQISSVYSEKAAVHDPSN